MVLRVVEHELYTTSYHYSFDFGNHRYYFTGEVNKTLPSAKNRHLPLSWFFGVEFGGERGTISCWFGPIGCSYFRTKKYEQRGSNESRNN